MPVGPARAGMIRAGGFYASGDDGWPRTSGDDPDVPSWQQKHRSLAPHERG